MARSILRELKTPVASLKLYLDTLEYRDVGDRRTEFYRTMRQDIERLNVTINNVLNAAMYTDRPVVDPQPLDLAKLVRRSIDLTRTRHQLPFEAIGYEGPATLLIESSAIRRSACARASSKSPMPRSVPAIVKTPSCTSVDKSGNSFGCGYTGKSGGGSDASWINETVDLSEYAGKKVQLRFEYVTDPALNGEGLLLDDVKIQAANYTEDFESGDGGWQSQGFARIQNVLPQTFRLALITQGNGGTTVDYIPVQDDQTATIRLSLKSGETAVLLITGTQRFTRLPAAYSIDVK